MNGRLVLADEEDNLVHALELSHAAGWWQSEIGVLHGLFTLYEHRGRLAEWAEVFGNVVADFLDEQLRPLAGREKWWSFITDHLLRIAYHQGDFDRAEFLARKIIDGEREAAEQIKTTEPQRLTGDQKQKLHSLAIAIGRLADILRDKDDVESVRLNDDALTLYRLIGDRVGISVRLFNLGHVYNNVRSRRDLEKAARFYGEAYASYPEQDRLVISVSRSTWICLTAVVAGRPPRRNRLKAHLRERLDEAVNYYEQAVVLDPPDAITNLARTHNQLGIAYGFSLTEQHKSIEHFKKAIEYFDRAGEWSESAGARLSVAQILLRTRARLAEAQEYAREALEIFESIVSRRPELDPRQTVARRGTGAIEV